MYEINIFQKPEKLCILEVETESETDTSFIPAFLNWQKEVTKDKSYDTGTIAKRQ